MEGPMNILHLIYSLEVGGMETMLIDIANTQASKGHKVEVVVVNDEIAPSLLPKFSPQVRVTLLRRRRGSMPLLLMARLNALVALRRPDVIHAHHPKFHKLLRPWARRLLLTIHDVRTPLTHCRGANMVAITDAVADDILDRDPGAKVKVIYNGIRTAALRRRGDRGAGSPFRIVQLARLQHDKKGQDILINALAMLKDRGLTDFAVDFIGSGPSRKYLGDLVGAKGLEKQVRFLGTLDRDTIYDSLADYDAMVHPSVYEGFGLIVAEAMAAGLPLVVTEYDGPWEVAARGALCLSARRGDAASVADAIAALAADYPAALARAARGLDYVQGYDIGQTVDNYLEAYRSMK